MGQITNAILIERGLRANFMKAFNNGERVQDIMPFVMVVRSTNKDEKYGWLGESPVMEEWIDERKLRGINDFEFTIVNRDYEATLKVDRNFRDDDQLGAVQVRIRDLASKARQHPRKLFFETLVDGATELGYDGVTFFNASHLESGVAQSNLFTGTSTGPYTVAEFSADFEGSRADMRQFTDDIGEPRNEGELDLWTVAGPDVEPVIDKILGADIINNTTNTLKGAAKKLITSRLTGEDWYLINAGGEIKPFIMQERKAIEFRSLDENSEGGFMRKELLFGVDYRIGFSFGVWYKAIKIDN